MRLYKLPIPYDYHKRSELLVMAGDMMSAREAFEAAILAHDSIISWAFWSSVAKWNELAVVDGVYVNEGCDC